MQPFKPTKEDLADAKNRRVPDVIAPNLKVLFVGINPGIYTAAVRRHFAHPANRFWKALYDGGFTPRLFSPFENEKLLGLGYGITNIVERPTLMAKEISRAELERGWQKLGKKVKHYKPRWLAICGIGAYQQLFGKENVVGGQKERIGETKIWLLPNPSGLSASFTPLRLARVFSQLKRRVDEDSIPSTSQVPDDRYLEAISRQVFETVISPKAAEKRWTDIQRAFQRFDIDLVATLDDDGIERLLNNEKIIRNRKKIVATIENAKELKRLRVEYGSLRKYTESFPDREKLISDLSKRVHYIGRRAVEKALKEIKKTNGHQE